MNSPHSRPAPDLKAANKMVRDMRGVDYYIRRLTEVPQILPYLEKDKVYAAYALCQLEPHRFPYTCWYLARGETGEALMMHATGSLRGPLLGFGADLFCLGDPAALEAILCLHPGPRFLRVWAEPEHASVLKRFYCLKSEVVSVLRYRTKETLPTLEGNAARLSGDDTAEINRLFRADGTIGFYRRKFIESGVWHGIFVDNRLVSVVGTQAISPLYGVAVIGPALTHPDYRNRGYSKLLRFVQSREVLETCPTLVSFIEVENTPAVRAGMATGAVAHGQVLATTAYRRDITGLASFIRRTLAQRRARQKGKLTIPQGAQD